MKRIAVCLEGYTRTDTPLDDPSYVQGYRELSAELLHRGGELWLTRPLSTYLCETRFSSGYLYQDGDLREVPGPIEADLLLNKSEDFTPDSNVPVINKKE